MTPTPYAKETAVSQEETNLRAANEVLKQKNFEQAMLIKSLIRAKAAERTHVHDGDLPTPLGVF